MNKKTLGIIVVAIAVIALISTFAYRNSNYIGTPLEPINKLIKIQYFDEDTYEEFKSILTITYGARHLTY